MEIVFFPPLGIGWIYGWILLCVWWLFQGLSVLAVPKDVRERLFEFDRSSWRTSQRASFAVGKLVGLVFLIVVALTQINFDSIEFLIGMIVFVGGLLGLVIAIHNFQNTPLDEMQYALSS